MIQNLWRHDEVIRYRITINQSLIFRKIISQQPQEVNSQFLHHCTDRCLSKNIDKKVTLIWPLLPVQTGSQSLKKNHISTTARGKFTIFAPLYRSLIVKKYLQKSDPIWPLLPVQTGSQSLARGKFTIFAQIVVCQKICTPIWPLLPVQTGSNCIKKIISQQPQEVNSQFLHHCTDR